MSSLGRFSGAPTATGSGTATVTATDFDGDTASIAFDWTVRQQNLMPTFGASSVSARSWTRNSAIVPFTVPAATGGDGALSYSATGLPAGVSMSASRQVSGTPTAAGTGTATVTARDRDGDTDSLSFAWSVAADLKPAFAAATLTKRDWTEGQTINAFTVPAAAGGRRDADLHRHRTALGRVHVLLAVCLRHSGQYRFGNRHCHRDRHRRRHCNDPLRLDRLAGTRRSGTDIRRRHCRSEGLDRQQNDPEPYRARRTSGDGTLSYTIENLPDGVSMSTARVVSGTPSMTGSGTAKVTATDADGDFATLTFKWTVYAASPLLSANPNPSTTSNFTVRWTAFRTNDQDYFLVETAPGGGTTSYAVDIKEPKHFIAKPDGTYAYRMKGCGPAYDRDTQAQVYRCTDLGNALTVTVDGPEPDTVAKQLNYTYTAHAGDFDNNTHTDLLIKRTSSGVGAGIFRTVILSQKTMGQFTLVAPSETDVMTMSAFPVASGVELVLEDYNLDGYVDVLLRGLASAITGALDQIVYAPGGETGGHSTALKALDSDFKTFLSEVTAWIENPAYFDDNAESVPITIVTGITAVIPG